MKTKRAISSYVLLIGVLALLATGSLLIYSVYSAVTKSTLEKIQRVDIKPLSGNLNQKVMTNIETRRHFSTEQLATVQSLDYSDKDGNYQQASTAGTLINANQSSNVATSSSNMNGVGIQGQ